MLTARIIVTPLLVKVFSPFSMRDVMRSIPGARWSPNGKFWSIDRAWLNMTADSLRASGCTVFVTDTDGNPWTGSAPGPHGHRATPASDWISAAFAACPQDKVAKLKRALLTVFHPDVGGDVAVTRQIVMAAEKRELSV